MALFQDRPVHGASVYTHHNDSLNVIRIFAFRVVVSPSSELRSVWTHGYYYLGLFSFLVFHPKPFTQRFATLIWRTSLGSCICFNPMVVTLFEQPCFKKRKMVSIQTDTKTRELSLLWVTGDIVGHTREKCYVYFEWVRQLWVDLSWVKTSHLFTGLSISLRTNTLSAGEVLKSEQRLRRSLKN